MNFFWKMFSRALMLLLVLPVTNSIKGLVAKWQGDDTSERSGRITLNPMVHLDLLGSLAIMLCGFGWAKPMPINFGRMKSYKRGVVLISLTDPITHFISSIICLNIASIISYTVSGYAGIAISIIFSTLAEINTCLGVIHLLPIPGMDGFTLLYMFAGQKFVRWYHYNQRMVDQVSLIVLFVLFFIGDLTRGLIDPLGWLIYLVHYGVLYKTTFWIPFIFT